MMLQTLHLSVCPSRRKYWQWSFWISLLSKDFSRRSVFSELKQVIYSVYERPKCIEKAFFIWINTHTCRQGLHYEVPVFVNASKVITHRQKAEERKKHGRKLQQSMGQTPIVLTFDIYVHDLTFQYGIQSWLKMHRPRWLPCALWAIATIRSLTWHKWDSTWNSVGSQETVSFLWGKPWTGRSDWQRPVLDRMKAGNVIGRDRQRL